MYRNSTQLTEGYLPLVLGGLGAMASALFMPWVTFTAPSIGRISQSGLATGSGKWFALAVAVLTFVASREALHPSHGKQLTVLVGVVAVAVALFIEYHDIASMAGEINGDVARAQVGFGLYAMGIGISASFAGILRRRSSWALLR